MTAQVSLPEMEAHHASKVLRLRVGDSIELFDGLGYVARGHITEISKKQVLCQRGPISYDPNDSNRRVEVAIGLPKGDRQRLTIEKLVELGVDDLIPLETEFGVATVNSDNLERLERYALEACKQCRRNRLMSIHQPHSMRELSETIQRSSGLHVETWVLHPRSAWPSALHMVEATKHYLAGTDSNLRLVIGPEGGFAQSEVEQMVAAGARVLSLGERILRVETAVAAGCTLAQLWLSLGSQSSVR